MNTTPPPVRQRPKRADVRARVLAAAREVFLADGYRRANLGEIAARAGFSKGAVYSNFGGKTDLFTAVITDQTSAVIESVLAPVQLLAGDVDRAEADLIADLAAGLADAIIVHSAALTMLAEFRSLAADDPDLAAIYGRLRRSQRDLLVDDLRRRAGDIRLDVAIDDAAATLLLTVVQSLAADHATCPEAMPRPLIDRTVRYAIRGMLR